MQDIQLMATDLDGTLIGSVDEFPLYSSFRDRIMRLRRENDAVWAVCSGRTFRSFRALLSVGKEYLSMLLACWRVGVAGKAGGEA